MGVLFFKGAGWFPLPSIHHIYILCVISFIFCSRRCCRCSPRRRQSMVDAVAFCRFAFVDINEIVIWWETKYLMNLFIVRKSICFSAIVVADDASAVMFAAEDDFAGVQTCCYKNMCAENPPVIRSCEDDTDSLPCPREWRVFLLLLPFVFQLFCCHSTADTKEREKEVRKVVKASLSLSLSTGQRLL